MKNSILKRFVFIAIGVLSTLSVFAQKGVPFLSNYELPSNMSIQNWSIIQGNDHLVYVLNRKGVYIFDGFEWEKMIIKGKPIAIFSSDLLFVSTDLEIGYIKKDQKGEFNYYSVQDTTLDIYSKFISIDHDIYASGTQHVSKIKIGDAVQTEPVYIEKDSTHLITDLFELNGIIYLIKNKNLVCRLDNGNANPIQFNLEKDETINFTFNHNNFTYLGTSTNRLFVFNGWQFKPVNLKDQNYFNASYMNGGISVDSNRFALSTLIGGCSVINSKTLETEATINYANGLPDDEIYSLGKDNNGGLWVAHGMGISRLDLNLPVKSFEHFTGLSGNILAVAEFNRTIYAGGSEGLFFLTKETKITQVEVPVIQLKQSKKQEEVDSEVAKQKAQPEDKDAKKKKKGFFARLFSKSDKAETQTAELTGAAGKKSVVTAAQKKMYSLQTISHVYKKIKNVEGKCKQLLVYQGKLLAATSTGVYEVENNEGKPVLTGNYILFVKPSELNKKVLFVCSSEGVSSLTYINDKWQENKLFSIENEYPMSLVEISENNLLVTTEFNIYKLSIVLGGEAISKQLTPSNIAVESPVVRKISGEVKVYTANQVYVYNPTKDMLIPEGTPSINANINTIYSQDGYSWVNIGKKWSVFSPDKLVEIDASGFLGLFDRVNDIFLNDKNEILLVNNYSQIIKISPKIGETSTGEFSLFLKQVNDSKGYRLDLRDIKLSYSNNGLNIKIGAPSFVKEKSVEFQYFIEGMSKKWSEWTNDPNPQFPYFPNGKYKILLKARDVLGRESPVYTLPFIIKPPIWKTWWFVSLCVVLVFFLFFMIVRYRERQLQKEKQILEQKVQERTKTIEEQKKVLEVQRDELAQINIEITQQKEEIEAQRDEIETQRDHIFKQNEEITQSIEYAKRIQTAVMPTKDSINAILPEHFILFKPRDIVSGDFYWMAKKNNKIVVAAADCTGHGVPGAFMSMLGISFLNEIVIGDGETKPSSILNRLRRLIKGTLSQTGKEGESKDGMDIALCVIDLEAKKLEFAGAYNPLYLIRNSELIEIKADKMPVGIYLQEKDSFTNNDVIFESGDIIYLFSDGYVSQFGGEYGRKYMAKPFKKMLAIISEKPMDKQCEMLEQEFEEWRGYNPQVDDILVIGVKFV